MNNISITPKGGTIASNVSGDQVTLTAPSVVKLNLNKADIKNFTRNGNDLVVTTKSGEVLVIHGFYSANGDSDLVLQDDRGALWWVEDPGTDGFQYVQIDSMDGLLAENATDNNTIAAVGIGGAALAGIAALIATNGGDDDNNNNNNNNGNNTGGGGDNGGNTGGGDNGGNTGGGDNGGNTGGGDNGGNTGGGDNGGNTGGGDNGGNTGGGDNGGNTGGGDNGGGDNGGGGGGSGGEDTTAPEPASEITVTDNAGQYQGPITAGGVTDDTRPVISGSAEAGAVVTVYDGDTLLGSVVADGDGRWSFSTPELGEGQHSLSVTVTDAAGNTSTSTLPFEFTIDTTPPAAADNLVVTDNVGEIQGPLLNGQTTDDNTPVLSGTAEAGAVVQIYDGSVLLGSAAVGSDGNWSFTTPELTNGTHTLSVTVTDAAGNISPATSDFVINVGAGIPPATTSLEIIDDSGSAVRTLSDGDSTPDMTPTLIGLTGANQLVTLYNGDVVLGSTLADASGQWSFTPAELADGSYAFRAITTDAAGNTSESITLTITIDTVAPPVAGDLVLSDDQGGTPVAVTNGNTSDTTPLLSGTAEPGGIVTIYDGETVLGSTTADDTGNWSFNTPELGEGSHSLTTTVTDAAGNTGPQSTPITFVVDTTAPDAATDLVLSNDQNGTPVAVTNGFTNDTTPLLSGTTEPGGIVTIYDGETVLGSTTADDAGAWSFNTPELGEGEHSLTTTVTDAAGNTGPQSEPVTFTVDTTAPAVAADLLLSDDRSGTPVAITNGFSGDATPVLSGTTEPGGIVTIYDGETVLGSIAADESGAWSFTTPVLGEGEHSLITTVTDAAGNTGPQSEPVTFTVDTLAPEAIVDLVLSDDQSGTPVAVTNGFTSDTTPVLSGTTEPGGIVTIYDGENVLGSIAADESGAWSFTTPELGEGEHSLITTVTDATGNTGPQSEPLTFTVDTTAPAVAADLLLSDDRSGTPVAITNGFSGDATPVLSGTAEPGGIVTIYDGETVLGSIAADESGAWSFTTPVLGEGEHSLITTVTDAAGNTGPQSEPVTFTVDTLAPEAIADLALSDDQSGTPVAVTNGFTSDTTPVLSGTTEPGGIVTIYDGENVLGSTTADESGTWSFTTPELDEGSYSLTTTVTDAAGNTGPQSEPFTFTVDTTAPAVAADLLLSDDRSGTPVAITNGFSGDATPVLSGTTEPGGIVTVYDGENVLGSITADESGAWSFTTPELGEGEHSLITTVTDAAGNTGPQSEPVTFTVDTSAPLAAANLVLSDDDGEAPLTITNGFTNDTTPLLSGTAEPGGIVTIYDGENVLGSTTADESGAWSFTTPELGEGEHSLITTVTDAAGNIGPQSDAVTFTVDITDPEAATNLVLTREPDGAEIAPGGITNSTMPVLSGQAEPGSIVTVSDGETLLGSVAVDEDGSWSFTSPMLEPGAHSLTTVVTDAAGNSGPASEPVTFTLDTSTPAAPADLQVSNDESGTAIVITNGFTNDTTPLLSGSGTPNGVVTIYDGDNVLGSVAVNGEGNWSFNTPALGDGDHTLSAVLTSPAGNSSAPSEPLVITIDTIEPDAAVNLQLRNDINNTIVAQNGFTNDTTPVLSGEAESGSTVSIYNGDELLGTVTVNSDNTWSFTPATPLDDATYTLTTIVTDAAGNSSDSSAAVIFTIDTVVPDAVVDAALFNDNGPADVAIDPDSTTSDNTPLFSGTAEANSVITLYDGEQIIGTTTSDGEGNWSFSPLLNDGLHNLSVTVTDSAGNISDPSTPISFTVDTVAPPAATDVTLSNDNNDTPVIVPNGGFTNDNTPLFRGSAEAGSTITITTQDGTLVGSAVVNDDGSWSLSPATALEDDSYTFSIVTSDAAGNLSAPVTLSATIDTDPPAIAVGITLTNNDGALPVIIANGSFTNDNTPFISGTAEANSVVTILNGDAVLASVTANASGQWSYQLPLLEDAVYNLTTTVTDIAGNTSDPSAVITFTVDTQLPVPATLVVSNDNGETPIVIPAGGLTSDNTPLLEGTAEANSLVIIYDGDVVLGSTTATAGGTWSFSSPALNDGPHVLSATVTDEVGNVSTPSVSFTVEVDATAPQPIGNLLLQNNDGDDLITIISNSFTSDNTPQISGTAEGNAVIRVFDGDILVGSTTASADGDWSLTTDTLTNGLHALTVTATDAAGNVSAPVTSISFNVDNTTPDPVLTFNIYSNAGTTPLLIANGGFTNDSTPVLRGTGVAGTVVNIIQDDTVIGSTAVGDNGVWRFETSVLTDDLYSFSVSVTNAAGTTGSVTGPLTVNIDTAAPATIGDLTVTDNVGDVTGALTSGAITDDTTPAFSGTAEAGGVVSIYSGNQLLGTATATDGSWSFTPAAPLNNGTYSFTFTVTDAAGNVSPLNASPAFELTVQAALPAVTSTLQITDDSGNTLLDVTNGDIIRDTTPVLQGLASPNGLVTIFDNDLAIGSVTADGEGQWSFTPEPVLDQGPHAIYVTSVDSTGNEQDPSATISFTVDSIAPEIVTDLTAANNNGAELVTIVAGGITNDSTPQLSGTAEANGLVTIYDGNNVIASVTADGAGAWSTALPLLSQGGHAISVTVTDAAGNVSDRSAALNFTVDTVAPAASSLVVSANDTAVLSGAFINDNTPTLTGTAEANATVTIYDGTVPLGSVVADGLGLWSFTTDALAEGSHALNVRVTDTAGNTGIASATTTVVIDTVAPVIGNLLLLNNNGSTPVTIAAGSATSDNTPLLSGTAEAGSIVTVRDGTTVLGSVTANGTGVWSFTSPVLADGLHTLTVTAVDAAGNASAPSSIGFTVLTGLVAPVTDLIVSDNVGTIQGPLVSGRPTDDTTPTLSGTATANSVVVISEGNTLLGSVVADGSGAWSFTTATLSEGSHPLSVTVRDAAGSSSAPVNFTVVVDTTAPALSTLVVTNDITGTVIPAGGYSRDTTPTLSGVAEGNSIVTVRDGTLVLGSVTAAADGRWSYTSSELGQGLHTLSVTATDVAGNISGVTSTTLIIDSLPPAAVTGLTAANNNGATNIVIPENGLTRDNTPLLSGSGEAGARVTIYDGLTQIGTATVGANGNWNFVTPVLGEGLHTLNVTQTDAAGNISPQASLTLRVDTVAPAASTLTIIDDVGATPVTLLNGAYTRDTTPTLNGTAEVGAIVTIFDGANALGSVTVGADGTWSYTTGALSNGAHTLSTTVTDGAGNVSTGNVATTLNIDTVPPAAVTGLLINTAGTSVTGSGEVGATVTVRSAGGTALGTATVGNDGSWSVTLNAAQTTGATLSVTQTDRAGNVSPSASLLGAIRIVATDDTRELEYDTRVVTVNNGTVSSTHTALVTLGLGNVLDASLLNSGNAYTFSVGPDDSRSVTLNGSVTTLLGALSTYSLNLYEQQSNGSWTLVSSQSNYINALISIGTIRGANVTYNNLGTGNYAVILTPSTNINLLPSTTVSTVSDFTTLAVTIAATVTGNLLANDTSSVAGTVPAGVAVTTVSGATVASVGNTVINTSYGTLTVDARGNYSYALKAGLDIDTLPAADTFSYSVRDTSGVVTSATLQVTLSDVNAATVNSTTFASLLADTSSEHDAAGSIWADATTAHSGTLIIINALGGETTVDTQGTTSIAGEFGVLQVSASGDYTYSLNADVNPQDITHKEVFSYTLLGTDGTISTHSFTIELNPVITGTSGADTLAGSAYDDTITGGAGADTLVYHLLDSADATGGNGQDTWTDFNVDQGDRIDISELLIGWNDSTSNINDFVKVDHTSDGNTVLSIDRDGSGTGYSATQLITLEGVNVSLEELLQQPHQNHTA